ncbi:glycosyltransferase family 1 protein [Agromyces sp. C10]|uniref:glycosyltransferase family 1 protein n=1 Tax=Agromyces sp. C10 TaxID=2935077 RepID=UPI00200AC183|nr:glycosyltransferase family 1 protein [Agromyces sp. C10]MCK8608653.1 glycosyltransferase family 1 protein [Agromyces sp. C10]
MSRPSLLILSFSDIRGDARVLKQVREFTRDYDVTTCGYGAAPDGVVEHLRIPSDAPAWRFDRVALVLRRFERAYRGNRAVVEAQRLLGERTFDVVLANDLDTVPLAIGLRPRGGVHADLHEYTPRQRYEDLRWRIFFAPLMAWLVRRYVRRADSVTTVGEGVAAEYERVFGIRAGVATNAAPYVAAAPTPVGEPIRLVHSGAGLRNRSITLMIDAVERATRPVTLDLYLTENDPGLIAEIRDRQSERVRLHPPVPYADLIRKLAEYDVGVFVLPPINFNYRWALPNKLFDFVQARLGIIVGPSPEMAGVVQRHGLGTVTAGFDADDLTREIDALTPERVAEWKAASDRAAAELSSETQVAVWRRAIDALAARARSA